MISRLVFCRLYFWKGKHFHYFNVKYSQKWINISIGSSAINCFFFTDMSFKLKKVALVMQFLRIISLLQSWAYKFREKLPCDRIIEVKFNRILYDWLLRHHNKGKCCQDSSSHKKVPWQPHFERIKSKHSDIYNYFHLTISS